MRYVEGGAEPEVDWSQVDEEKRRVASFTSGEVDTGSFEYKTRRIVNEYIQPPKSETRLRSALGYLEQLRSDEGKLEAVDPHGVMKALEACFILDCVEMCARASMERRESRWGLIHQRVDYPKRADAVWLRYVVVTLGEDGEIRASSRPIGEG